MHVKTVWRMVWLEVRAELEGPVRRLFQEIDENDSDEGDSPGNGEKWTDSK